MTCEEVRDQLVLLCYGELDDESRAEVELHLHGCPACSAELEAQDAFAGALEMRELPELPANLLAASRVKLDEALDEAGESTWGMRLRSMLVGTWQHLYAAPALATMLVGVGFLGGTSLVRYQVAHQPVKPVPVRITDNADAVVGTISRIEQLDGPDRLRVQYSQIVPTEFQGSIDDPGVQRLLMMAAERSADTEMRATSVGYLVQECKAGRSCDHGKGDAADVRDALLTRLRYDKSAAVRLKALEGLQPYVGADHRVRDTVLETLQHDSSADVRERAISLLEPVEGDSSVRQVLHTVSVQDANPLIRNVSMQVLGNVDGIQ